MRVRGRTTAFWRTGALLVLVGPLASALSAQRDRLSVTRTPAELPDAPGASREASFQLSPSAQQASAPQAVASVAGIVLDTDGAAVKGAFIVLEDIRTNDKHAAQSGEDGTFVFAGVAATTYKVSVSAPGFAPYVNGSVVAHPGETLQLPQIALEIAPVSISVDAVFSPYEMAEDEIRVEEKQRVLLIVPNFYVTYNWRAARSAPARSTVSQSATTSIPLPSSVPASQPQSSRPPTAFPATDRARPDSRGASEPPTETSSSAPFSAVPSSLHSFIRIPATSTRAPAPSKPARSTPSPLSSSARATTASGSPTTRTSSAPSQAPASPTPTIPPRTRREAVWS